VVASPSNGGATGPIVRGILRGISHHQPAALALAWVCWQLTCNGRKDLTKFRCVPCCVPVSTSPRFRGYQRGYLARVSCTKSPRAHVRACRAGKFPRPQVEDGPTSLRVCRCFTPFGGEYRDTLWRFSVTLHILTLGRVGFQIRSLRKGSI
jgi:hypothetical protein